MGALRRHLGWKLFLSYLAVLLVGAVVLATATELAVPSSFDRHVAAMSQMMHGMMGGDPVTLELDLYRNFQSAVNEALTLAMLAAFGAALVASVLISRRVVMPVSAMTAASRRIADGHYEERVALPGLSQKGEGDELSQLALSFNQMADRLEQTETMRRELIGNVAHELRTPLTSIKGYMEGLIDGVLPADPATFQKIYHEADRLQRLIVDLQELSRVEAGAYELNRRPVPPATLLRSVTDRLARQFEEKGVALDLDLPTGLPAVSVDEDRIGQVLLNLVGNALQYTPAGGRVTLSARVERSFVRLRVQDTGIGVGVEHLPHLFTRFYRVDRSRSRVGGGSGIGLTIARYLVEAHGGSIEAASDGPGRGSTFSFTLPVA